MIQKEWTKREEKNQGSVVFWKPSEGTVSGREWLTVLNTVARSS